MKGLIMDYPLTLTQFFERARKIFPRKTMATRVPAVGLWRYTYADYADRRCRLSAALAKLGLAKGDRVGTFAWNSHRHMEVYFAAPLMGMVLHTVTIRLSPQGSLLRPPPDGHGAPHGQHPTLAAGHHLHHQPRRGPSPRGGREPVAP